MLFTSLMKQRMYLRSYSHILSIQNQTINFSERGKALVNEIDYNFSTRFLEAQIVSGRNLCVLRFLWLDPLLFRIFCVGENTAENFEPFVLWPAIILSGCEHTSDQKVVLTPLDGFYSVYKLETESPRIKIASHRSDESNLRNCSPELLPLI